MHDSAVSVSTRQASELLGVHESSIKRWCNADELDHWLTPGGHRRIPIAALVAFAQGQAIELPLRHFGEEAGRVWAGREQAQREDDFGELVELTYAWVAQGRSWEPVRLIEHLVREGFMLGRIFDQMVGPVLRRIGAGYLEGTLSIGDEHRMTQAMRDALIELRALSGLGRPANGQVEPTVVVGCARNEVHELGALMVRLLLENEGWRVIYLGLNVPTEDFAAQQLKYDASLVCISMMPPMGLPEAQAMVRLLDRMYDPERPYRLVFGGSGFGGAEALDYSDTAIPEVKLFSKMTPFATWARALA